MTSIKAPHNLHECAQYREFHGKAGITLKLQQQIVIQNIALDRFVPHLVNLGSFDYFKREGHWIVSGKDNRISLYSLIARKKLWTCELPSRPNCLMSADISVEGNVTAYAGMRTSYKVEISNQGEIQSDTCIENGFEATKFLRDCSPLVTILRNMTFKAADMIIKANPTGLFCSSDARRAYVTKWYFGKNFFVTMLNHWQKPGIPTKVFVFNHLTRKTHIFDVDEGPHMRDVFCAQLHQNLLFYSSDRLTGEDLSSFVRSDSKITVVNLLTEQVVQTYPNQSPNGRIVKLIVNEDYLVYTVTEPGEPYQLWCIDRQTHTQALIMSTENEPTQFFFSGPLLLVNDLTTIYQTIVVYDCSKSALIKRVWYPREFTDRIVSFEEGLLTIADPSNQDPAASNLYIEDFANLHQPVNPEANTMCKKLRYSERIPFQTT